MRNDLNSVKFQALANNVLELIKEITAQVDKEIVKSKSIDFKNAVEALDSFIVKIKNKKVNTGMERMEIFTINMIYDELKIGINLVEKIINETH